MNIDIRRWAACAAAMATLYAFTGCEGSGGGGSDDVGENDPELVVCVGDSITAGMYCEGAPFPARLAEKSGKTVLNYGVGGAPASSGVSNVKRALARKPGYVCILYGANDAIQGAGYDTTEASLRAMVQACKENQSIPIIATPTPQRSWHEIFDGRVSHIAEIVRTVAKEEGARLVDLNSAFGNGDGLLVEDGLHMTDKGSDLIAEKFNGRL